MGKSFLSFAAALESARAGHRTLLVELGESHQSARYSDSVESLSYEPEQLYADLPLFACRITVPEALEEYGVMKLKFKRAYRMVFENDMVRRMLDLLPGMDELLMLGKLWFMDQELNDAGEPMWERIIVDAPATGHGLSLLSLPHAILGTVESGAFARETRPMLDMLRDPERTRVYLVTLPAELPVRETAELAEQIRDELGIALGGCFINKIWEKGLSPELRNWLIARSEEDVSESAESALTQYLSRALSRQDHQGRYIEDIKSRIADIEFVEIPYIFVEKLGRSDMAAVQVGIFS